MIFSRALLPLAAPLAFAACAVAPPQGPTVLALPGQGKSFAQFQQEDASCRFYAAQQNGFANPNQAATQSAVGSAAVGTALGAAAGAVIGAAAGNPGAGAAIGAGSGLLVGSGVGANNAYATGASLQQRYDITYTQCMYAHGNTVQASAPLSGPVYAGSPGFGYAYPGWGWGPYWGGTTVAVGVGGGWGWGGGWGHPGWGWGGWRGGGWGWHH
jgi:Glycine-zipper domain